LRFARRLTVKECKPGGSEAQGLDCQVKFSAHEARFELGGAVAAITETLRDRIKIREKVDLDAAIRRDLLTQVEISGLAPNVTFSEYFKRALVSPKAAGTGREIAHRGASDHPLVWAKLGTP
jgi:hypothetical protein